MSKLYIDVGAETKEEAEQYVSVGSFGTFESEFYTFGKDDGFLKAKALDDRMGCAVMLEVMASLMADRPTEDLDLYFCFTVREEIGLSGARTAAEKIAPHIEYVSVVVFAKEEETNILLITPLIPLSTKIPT
jgi:endoglucanase